MALEESSCFCVSPQCVHLAVSLGPVGRFQMHQGHLPDARMAGWNGGRASSEMPPKTLTATQGNPLFGATSIANTGNIYQAFLEK